MDMSLPAERHLVLETRIPMRWGDMDAMGHINNTVYFRYMEIARLDWLEQLQARVRTPGHGAVIVNAFCNFQRELRYPGQLLVRTYTGKVGRSSVLTYHTMAREDDPETVCATGGAKVVWIDLERRKSVPLDPALLELLQA